MRLVGEELVAEEVDPREALARLQEQETEELMSQSSQFTLIYARDEKEAGVKLTDFQVLNLIGNGSISNVYLVKRKGVHRPLAMKCIQKELVLDEGLFQSTKLEKDLLISVSIRPSDPADEQPLLREPALRVHVGDQDPLRHGLRPRRRPLHAPDERGSVLRGPDALRYRPAGARRGQSARLQHPLP